jgi:hypothetical protein
MAERQAPYPGLRSFRRDEVELFFGREDDVDKVIDKLAKTHFVAVLGASGSGKSSLVRTGVVYGLELGLLREAGSSWQVVDFRPGSRPIANLAAALLASRDSASHDAAEVDALAAYLRRGPRSIVEWCRAGYLRPGANLLLLVDQFEELFNFQSYAAQDHAQAFVSLLIESAHQSGSKDSRLPIYVALTMRSEYLGACALLEGLTEAINQGQYLTPRLSRQQCRIAIEDPAGVGDAEIEKALVNRLLNDLGALAPWDDDTGAAGDDPLARIDQLDRLARRADQLPLLQHVLNRLWTQSRDRGDEPPKLTVEDYESAGGLRGMLSAHADEILKDLVAKHGKPIEAVVQKVFRALVSGTSIATAVRRPTSIGKLAELNGGDIQSVRLVVDAYRAPGCSFLVSEARELREDVKIDISHESLIRQWALLRRWVEREAASAAWWRSISERSRTWKKAVADAAKDKLAEKPSLWLRLTGRSDVSGLLLRDAALTQAVQFRAQYAPTQAWAELYGGGYPEFDEFMSHSRRVAQIRRIVAWTSGAAGVAAVVTLAVLLIFWIKANEDNTVARSELIELRVGAILNEVKGKQGGGDHAMAGAILGRLLEPILTDDQADLKLPDTVKATVTVNLREILQKQHAAIRNRSKTFDADKPDVNNEPRWSSVGGPEFAMVAKLRDDGVKIYQTVGPRGDWQESKLIGMDKLLGRRPPTSKDAAVPKPTSLVGLYGPDKLAIAFADAIHLGDIQAIEQGDIRKARVERMKRDSSREQDKGATLPQEASFTYLFNCRWGQPNFLAFDSAGATWLIVIDGNRARARKLFDAQERRTFSFDLEGGRYAMVYGDRVFAGPCTEEGLEVEPAELLRSLDGGVKDVEFTAAGQLGVAEKSGLIRYVLMDGNAKREESAAVTIPPRWQLVRFADNRRLWLRDGKNLVLWDTAQLSEEGSILIDAEPVPIGSSHWVAFQSRTGALTVGRPLKASESVASRSTGDLARIVAVAGGSGQSEAITENLAGLMPLLAAQGMKVRSLASQAAAARFECADALGWFTEVLEQRRLPVRRAEITEGARRLRTACDLAKLPDEQEKTLLSWLAKRIVNDASIEAAVRDSLPYAAPLAARGNNYGYRLLAIAFESRGVPATAFELAELAATDQIPYMLIQRARRGSAVRAMTHGRTALEPAIQTARFLELEGLELQAKDRSAAMKRFIAAQRLYHLSGDDEGVSETSTRRWELATSLEDEQLLALWHDMVALETPKGTPGQQQKAVMSPTPQPAHIALAAISGRLQAPDAKDELLLAAAENAPDLGTKTESISTVASSILARAKSSKPPPGLFTYRVARRLMELKQTDKAAEVLAAYLTAANAPTPESNPFVSYTTLDVLRTAVKSNAAALPAFQKQLAAMDWKLVNFRWYHQRSRDLLTEALNLQSALVNNGVSSRSLQLARARTLFWLGTISDEQAKLPRFAEAVKLFDELASDDREVRLQLADAIRLKASVMPQETVEEMSAVAAERQRARRLYEELLPELDLKKTKVSITDKSDENYVRTAAVSGLSGTLQGLGTIHAETAAKMLAKGDREKGYREALEAMRSVHAQSQLFSTELYEDIQAGNPTITNLCCLGPESQAEDAWAVAIVAGAESLRRGNSGPLGECERLATHPYDPLRRTIGGPADGAIGPCEAEKAGDGGKDVGRHAFLLGRSYARVDHRRDEALEQLGIAAGEKYAQAFYNLSYELNRASTRCPLAPALLDRYRYLVFRDHLAPALKAMQSEIRPSDGDMIADLEELARREPSTTAALPRLGKPITLELLNQACQ